MVLLLPQQLQDEVPQLDLSGARAGLGLVGPLREGEPWVTRREREVEVSDMGRVYGSVELIHCIDTALF